MSILRNRTRLQVSPLAERLPVASRTRDFLISLPRAAHWHSNDASLRVRKLVFAMTIGLHQVDPSD